MEDVARGLSRESLKVRAETELLLLDAYDVKLPPRPQNVEEGPVDETSVRVLEILHPVVLRDFKPLRVAADGNCFYRQDSSFTKPRRL